MAEHSNLVLTDFLGAAADSALTLLAYGHVTTSTIAPPIERDFRGSGLATITWNSDTGIVRLQLDAAYAHNRLIFWSRLLSDPLNDDPAQAAVESVHVHDIVIGGEAPTIVTVIDFWLIATDPIYGPYWPAFNFAIYTQAETTATVPITDTGA